jgi:hypothetical protein
MKTMGFMLTFVATILKFNMFNTKYLQKWLMV